MCIWPDRVLGARSRLRNFGHAGSHGELARALLRRVTLLELGEDILERARAPFPVPVRTLDALHLASIIFLNGQGQTVTLATYDRRLLNAARAMNLPLAVL
jgi:predicted nucleic acid-binding protein